MEERVQLYYHESCTGGVDLQREANSRSVQSSNEAIPISA